MNFEWIWVIRFLFDHIDEMTGTYKKISLRKKYCIKERSPNHLNFCLSFQIWQPLSCTTLYHFVCSEMRNKWNFNISLLLPPPGYSYLAQFDRMISRLWLTFNIGFRRSGWAITVWKDYLVEDQRVHLQNFWWRLSMDNNCYTIHNNT